MKRLNVMLVLAALIALMASPVIAAPARLINYQGRLTDPSGNDVADAVYTLAFKIYNVPTGGSSLWSETLPVQVTDGLFTVQLGANTPIPSDLFSGGEERHLGVTVSVDPEIAPRTLLNWVAHAYYALDADVAQNLTCTGCVSATDIATDAVGAAEIATDAVTAVEIAASAVGSSEVADGSLSAIDIDDEPGVASNTTNSIITLDGTIQTVLSRAIIAPAAGYVLVIATTMVTESHGSVDAFARFGVSSTLGVFPSNQQVGAYTRAGTASGVYTHPVTVHGLFSTAGGSDTFYFLAEEQSGSFEVKGVQFTLIYFPTAHGIVVSTSTPSSGELSSDENTETGSVLLASASGSIPGENADLPVSKQELALMKAEMEARIQQLEASLRQSRSETKEKR